MKLRKIILLFALAVLIANVSCSTDVDLYTDYKDIPVIYGLLDYDADTNFIKVTRNLGYHEDLGAAAQDPNLSNYPGKLDVRITEFRNKDSIRQIILDTITIHNKQNGLFYAPEQKMYYTTEPLHKNTTATNFTYRLTVKLPEQTVVSDALIVGTDDNPFVSTVVDFSGGAKNILFYPIKNAGVYDARMAFSFLEKRTPDSDLVLRTFDWPIGTFYAINLNHHLVNGAYVISYVAYNLDTELEKFLGNDTAVPGLTRYLSDYPFKVILTAGGENLAQYLLHNESSHDSFDPENNFLFIEGAYGVFSSKVTKVGKMRPGGTTLPDLLHSKWGFKYVGGDF